MNKILLDTTIFLAHLSGNTSLQKLLTEDNELFTTVNVLEETFYKSIILRTFEKFGTTSKYTAKNRYIKHPEDYEDIILFFEDFITFLTDNTYLSILDLNYSIFKISIELSRNYRLLPNDALIAASCTYYGINKIATLDGDFECVDFLEIIEP